MKCTREEALLVLGGWYERNTLLLLDLRLNVGANPMVIRGYITRLAPDDLLFSSLALTVAVCLSHATFEYEELTEHERKLTTPDDWQRGTKLQLSARWDSSFRDDLSQPETTVSISEIAVS